MSSSSIVEMFQTYLEDQTGQTADNANAQRSVAGLNNYVRENFTREYWLSGVYPPEIAQAHRLGDIHIHDLGFYGPYCAGWDLRQLLIDGFGGVAGKAESKPARHLRSFLGQVVNSTFTTQGECAGAQAWSSFDTYCAPFIRYDGLTFSQVKQALQEFIFNINVPTRVGFQSPFSNLTFDLQVPKSLANLGVIRGGELQEEVYGDFQAEMDMLNLAFCEVMMEGDARGRVFTFPIPTINVTPDFDWESPVVDAFMGITAKYGIPYFANFVNSDLSAEDAVSMCCRLRLDTKELKKRGGGLFGSNPLTGSIGVVTLNLPRIGFLAKDRKDFFERLAALAVLAKESLELKRLVLEKETNRGLYPYSARFLSGVKDRSGEFWSQHFCTIGLVGMHEALLNFGVAEGIRGEDGRGFALEVLHFLRESMLRFQLETGHFYNLEATPAEGTAPRLARLDLLAHPGILTAGKDHPFYTNSTQLPVEGTPDLFTVLNHQEELQNLYTGGTVLHAYLGERVENPQVCKSLIRKIFTATKLPYLSLSPTFSICSNHGYLNGEQEDCPECGIKTEVWTRVVGYLRPVENFGGARKEEFKNRETYSLGDR